MCGRRPACHRAGGIGPDATRRARDVCRVGRRLPAGPADAGGPRRRRSAPCRTACATTSARTASRPAAPSCGSSSEPGRCSKTTTRRGWRISSSTWSSKARSTFRRSLVAVSVVARVEHRPRRERRDPLQRHAIHAPRADGRARRPRSRAARARGLGPRRLVRSERHRARARHRAVGVAHEPRRAASARRTRSGARSSTDRAMRFARSSATPTSSRTRRGRR